jgi:hypothetical protein
MTSTIEKYTVPLFGGQGSRALFSEKAAGTAVKDAESPAGKMLLAHIHQAFINEIDSLSDGEKATLGFSHSDFAAPENLLQIPDRLQNNPILHGTTLCLFQLLRYLGHVEATARGFDAVLETAGFCFGVLPAAVVACSRNMLEYMQHSIEAFRLSFWIGVRCSDFAGRLMDHSEITADHSWSLALVGWGKKDALERLSEFAEKVRLLFLVVLLNR